MTRRHLVPLGIVGAVVALLVVGLMLRPAKQAASEAAEVGHTAPSFNLPAIDGKTVSLSDLRGKPVLLNFWATWCRPCRSEMPLLSRLYATHKDQIEVVAIDKQEPADDVQSFVNGLKLSFVPVLDEDGSVFRRYRVSNLQPSSFWIDQNGVIRALYYGQMSESNITRELKRLNIGAVQS